MSYNISIPEPVLSVDDAHDPLFQLAQIVAGDYIYEMYWRVDHAQVVIQRVAKEFVSDAESRSWFIQEDGNIMDAMSHFLPYEAHQIVAHNLVVLREGEEFSFQPADIYACSWSDFACDKLSLLMDLYGVETIDCPEHRLSFLRAPVVEDV
jgi:hypothetical protein